MSADQCHTWQRSSSLFCTPGSNANVQWPALHFTSYRLWKLLHALTLAQSFKSYTPHNWWSLQKPVLRAHRKEVYIKQNVSLTMDSLKLVFLVVFLLVSPRPFLVPVGTQPPPEQTPGKRQHLPRLDGSPVRVERSRTRVCPVPHAKRSVGLSGSPALPASSAGGAFKGLLEKGQVIFTRKRYRAFLFSPNIAESG